MAKHGRLVQFNSLEINFGKARDWDSDERRYQYLGHHLMLKYFTITGMEEDPEGHFEYSSLATMLKYGSRDLRSLTIDGIAPLSYLKGSLTFPRLEEFTISKPFYSAYGLPESSKTETLGWLLRDAPNLKRISVADFQSLRFFPDEILTRVKLQGLLKVGLWRKQDVSLLCQVSKKISGMEGLRLYEPPSDLELDGDVRHQFDSAVERMLQRDHHRLKSIEIFGLYSLSSLSHPPFSNLLKLSINRWNVETLEDLWDAMASVNFAIAMPKLEEVEICIPTTGQYDQFGNYVHDAFWQNDWPIANYDDVRHCAPSVRKLTLDLEIRGIRVHPLQALFPNISSLQLKCTRQIDSTEWTVVPLADIWECWPQLEDLKKTWRGLSAIHSYDADFCGIHQEEVDMLAWEGREYLQNVHIVPIRPCILTMSSKHFHKSLSFALHNIYKQ